LTFITTYFLGVFYGLSKYKFSLRKENLKKDFYQHLNISKWLLPSGIMQWTSINLFLVVSSFILGPIAVGAIKIGQNIIMAFNVILQGIENFIPSDASQLYKKFGREKLNNYLLKVTKIGLIGALLFGLLTSLFAEEIILLFYGDIYLKYSYILIWYALILLFMYLLSINRVLLRTIDKTKIWFKSYLIASLYAMFVAYPLIIFFEINGVMFGILSAHIVLLMSSYIILKKEEKSVYEAR
jgi:O-antigen/teichoic acid export membrane protein